MHSMLPVNPFLLTFQNDTGLYFELLCGLVALNLGYTCAQKLGLGSFIPSICHELTEILTKKLVLAHERTDHHVLYP